MNRVSKGVYFRKKDGTYFVDTRKKITGEYHHINKSGFATKEEAEQYIKKYIENPSLRTKQPEIRKQKIKRIKEKAKEARLFMRDFIPYIKVAFHYDCAYCKKRPEKESDLECHHIIPLSEGGADKFENIIPLCHECHQKAHKGEIGWFDLFKLSKTEIQVQTCWAIVVTSIEKNVDITEDILKDSIFRSLMKTCLKTNEVVFPYARVEFDPSEFPMNPYRKNPYEKKETEDNNDE